MNTDIENYTVYDCLGCTHEWLQSIQEELISHGQIIRHIDVDALTRLSHRIEFFLQKLDPKEEVSSWKQLNLDL